MFKNEKDKTCVTSHTFELKHDASGKFLDVRGLIADFIREAALFPHWKISENAINFFDSERGIQNKGAVISYNNIGFLAYNPPTYNYFKDQVLSFWRKLKSKKGDYAIPRVNRFGVRTLCFLPTKLDFEEINNRVYSNFFSEALKSTISGKQTDLQIVLELKENDFSVRTTIGPLKKGEAKRYFDFKANEFEFAGLYLDIDYFQNALIDQDKIQELLNKAMGFTWEKIESIAKTINI